MLPFSLTIESCMRRCSTERGLDVLCLSASSRSVPSLIAARVDEMASTHVMHCASMPKSSSTVSSTFLGPDPVSRTPSDEACLSLARSKRSTPIHASNAQLSGPEMPGAQMREEGNRILTVCNASDSIPGR